MTYTTEQQAENRAKWVEALRSGDYEQGRGRLFVSPESAETRKEYYTSEQEVDWTKPGHCCLGVAADLAVKEGVVEQFEDSLAFPSDEVIDWLGLAYRDGPTSVTWDSGTSDRTVSLSSLNDDFGLTFNEIADLIEEGAVIVQ